MGLGDTFSNISVDTAFLIAKLDACNCMSMGDKVVESVGVYVWTALVEYTYIAIYVCS